jgi:hypothetical protein
MTVATGDNQLLSEIRQYANISAKLDAKGMDS